MKNAIIFFGLSMLSSLFTKSFTQSTRNFAITFDKVVVISNNHVGHNWENYLKVGDLNILEGETASINLKRSSPLRIKFHSVELDKSHSDFGMESLELDYSDAIRIEKSQFDQKVVVTEVGGQYSGNQAVLKFFITVRQETP